jgi:hypothetical protein
MLGSTIPSPCPAKKTPPKSRQKPISGPSPHSDHYPRSRLPTSAGQVTSNLTSKAGTFLRIGPPDERSIKMLFYQLHFKTWSGTLHGRPGARCSSYMKRCPARCVTQPAGRRRSPLKKRLLSPHRITNF